nr:MAG TPA: hypothetical protein [Caudoviricetes sp.]
MGNTEWVIGSMHLILARVLSLKLMIEKHLHIRLKYSGNM